MIAPDGMITAEVDGDPFEWQVTLVRSRGFLAVDAVSIPSRPPDATSTARGQERHDDETPS